MSEITDIKEIENNSELSRWLYLLYALLGGCITIFTEYTIIGILLFIIAAIEHIEKRYWDMKLNLIKYTR